MELYGNSKDSELIEGKESSEGRHSTGLNLPLYNQSWLWPDKKYTVLISFKTDLHLVYVYDRTSKP